MWPDFDHEPEADRPLTGNALGLRIHDALDLSNPVGKWTGLDPRVGAPLSGALWGAGAGLTYAGLRKLFRDPEEEEEEPSMWMPTAIGAAAGLGLGAWSGHLQHEKQTSLANRGIENAIAVLRRDRGVSDAQADRIEYALRRASPDTQRRIVGLLAVGGLTALAASKILGLGMLGSALTGGVAAYTFNNWTRQPREI